MHRWCWEETSLWKNLTVNAEAKARRVSVGEGSQLAVGNWHSHLNYLWPSMTNDHWKTNNKQQTTNNKQQTTNNKQARQAGGRGILAQPSQVSPTANLLSDGPLPSYLDSTCLRKENLGKHCLHQFLHKGKTERFSTLPILLYFLQLENNACHIFYEHASMIN